VVSDQPSRWLSYAVRPRVVARHWGELNVALAAASLPPLAAALWFGDLLAAALLAGIALGFGGMGEGLRRLRNVEPLRTHEALVVVTGIFAWTALVMTPVFIASGMAPADALFESVSAITTTGLTTLVGVDGRPGTILFLRAWLQWVGGLGVVVLSVALLAESAIVMRRLEIADSAADLDLAASTRTHARLSLIVYGGLSVVTFAACRLAGLRPFEALLHTLAAVSTGGFSSHDASVAALGGAAQIVLSAACFAGALSLTLWARLRRRGPRALTRDVELRALVVAAAVLALALTAVLWRVQGLALPQALHHGAFLAISAQTTTGFESMPIETLAPAAKLLLMLGMITGGSTGSTAGGIKMLRVLVVISALRWSVGRLRMPGHAVARPRLGGEPIAADEAERVLAVLTAYGAVSVLSWLAFLLHGYDPLDALFEVTSALGTVGLSTGITSSGLENGLKGVLCLDMLAGRVEFIAILVTLTPRTWLGRTTE
jgi:trk/ktr system potassium uptake protein